MTSGSFRHSYITETKCLKKSEQSQIITAYREQYTDTHQIHKYSTRAKAEGTSQLLPESTGALDKMRIRLNIINKVPEERVLKQKVK